MLSVVNVDYISIISKKEPPKSNNTEAIRKVAINAQNMELSILKALSYMVVAQYVTPTIIAKLNAVPILFGENVLLSHFFYFHKN